MMKKEEIKENKYISFKTKSDTGILIIHGFTSNTSSIQYYANGLYKNGFNIEAPLLSGHGTKWEDLNKTSYRDWIKDIELSLKKLKNRAKKIFVSGFSMGGTLALRLAFDHPELNGLILINHALFLKKDWRMPLVPIIMHFKEFENTEVGGDLKDPDVWEDAYDRIPLKGLYQFIFFI